MSKVITPRNEDYSKWYLDVATEAGLAENSPVRGCMIIKPYGFAIWENMREFLEVMTSLSTPLMHALKPPDTLMPRFRCLYPKVF